MEGTPDEAAPSMGTLVIRTWTEATRTSQFRARLTYSPSPSVDPTTIYTADPDEVLDLVRHWLLAQSGSPEER